MVPAAVLILGYGQHIGQGISLVVMIPTTLAGAVTHYRMKNLKLKPVFLIAIGAVAAGLIAAAIAQQLSQATLQRVFSLWVLYSAIRAWGVNDWIMRRFFGKEPVEHKEEVHGRGAANLALATGRANTPPARLLRITAWLLPFADLAPSQQSSRPSP